jgi:hypothetical protein
MIARGIFAFVYLVLAGCSYHTSSASISKVCPGGVQRINLELTKATDKWVFNAHAGAYGNIVENYHFIIPTIPAERRAFGVQEFKLENAVSLTKDIPPIDAGEIVIDPQKKEAMVSIKTIGGGDFPGNGKYPLSYFSFDGSDFPKPETLKLSCGRPKPFG